MLTPRLTNCPECADINGLLQKINCKLAHYANNLYNNIVFILNKDVSSEAMIQLLAYKRILTYKQCNPDYLNDVCMTTIVSKIIRLTSGCYIEPIFTPTPTTSTTSTSTTCPPYTTTTTTAAPTTTTTSSTSTSTSTTTIAPITTTTTTLNLTTTTTTTAVPVTTTTTTTVAPLYEEIMTVGDGFTQSYGFGQGYGSITNNASIPLFGVGATIHQFDQDNFTNLINFQIDGVPGNEPPTNWTTITIGDITYNRTQFTMSFGNPWWYFQLTTTPSPFGTTVGANKTITIL